MILPSQLRSSNTTPAEIPAVFPRFPPKYTYKFTSTFPPRAVDPETIRRRTVEERSLIQASLARLIQAEYPPQNIEEDKGAMQVWWDTWEQVSSLEGSKGEVWPVERPRRSGTWSM
jgi:Transcription factor TFIID complex subunit 8 C-term